jgi:hypothetical protein
VYKFLKNIHRDDDQESQVSDYIRPDSCASSALSPNNHNNHNNNHHNHNNHAKTQSLEDILDNLKKYRQKFHRQAGSKSAKAASTRGVLPSVHEPSLPG